MSIPIECWQEHSNPGRVDDFKEAVSLQKRHRLHDFILVFDNITIENTIPISAELILTTSSSVAPNSHLAMSATSSRHTLDLEISNCSTRRARPTPSPRSPLSPRSPVRDLFDGRVDRDYFGQKDDISDMKVSFAHLSRQIEVPYR